MRKWIAPSLFVASLIITAVVFPRLPAMIPSHWSMAGEVDGWSSKVWGAWTLPAMLLVISAMIRWLPSIDPRGANYARFAGTFEGMMILVMLFIFGLHMVVLATALGRPVSMQRLGPAGMGLLLLGIGNLLPRARPNWFVGIRTPWTLSNDRVWERTHRFGGYLFVTAGLLVVAAALVAPRLAFSTMIGVCAASAAGVLIYSYIAWRQEGGAKSSESKPLPPTTPAT